MLGGRKVRSNKGKRRGSYKLRSKTNNKNQVNRHPSGRKVRSNKGKKRGAYGPRTGRTRSGKKFRQSGGARYYPCYRTPGDDPCSEGPTKWWMMAEGQNGKWVDINSEDDLKKEFAEVDFEKGKADFELLPDHEKLYWKLDGKQSQSIENDGHGKLFERFKTAGRLPNMKKIDGGEYADDYLIY